MQLHFELNPKNPFSIDYFVPHTGVLDAIASIEQTVNTYLNDKSTFELLCFSGPKGSGRTHLIEAYRSRLSEAGVSKVLMPAFDFDVEPREVEVAQFVSSYEETKKRGGILFVKSLRKVKEVSSNPHVQSRLLNGIIANLSLPSEAELEALVASIAERRNLRLPERSVSYLLKRTAKDSLSISQIIKQIDELALSTGKPASLSTVRRVLSESVIF